MTTAELKTATLRIVRKFKGAECVCGKGKLRHVAFCKSCYSSLPKELQDALWLLFNEGFIPAYLDAEEYLAKAKTEDLC